MRLRVRPSNQRLTGFFDTSGAEMEFKTTHAVTAERLRRPTAMLLPLRPAPVLRGQPPLGSQRGSITLIGLMIVFVMSLLGAALYSLSTARAGWWSATLHDALAFHAAEAGLYRAYRDLVDGDGTNDFATIVTTPPASWTGYTNEPFNNPNSSPLYTPSLTRN